MAIDGQIAGTDHTLLLKMDSEFEVIWERAIPGKTSHGQISMTDDESYILISMFSSSSCRIIKLNTADGSFALQKSINSANN